MARKQVYVTERVHRKIKMNAVAKNVDMNEYLDGIVPEMGEPK